MSETKRDPDQALPDGLRRAQLRARSAAPQWLMIVVALATAALAMYWIFANKGPAAWLISAQVSLLGGYYPKVTFFVAWILLMLPAVLVVQGIGVWKARRAAPKGEVP